MKVSIIDEGASIRLSINNIVHIVPKPFGVSFDNNNFTIKNELFYCLYSFTFENVVSPLYANGMLLLNAIKSMLNKPNEPLYLANPIYIANNEFVTVEKSGRDSKIFSIDSSESEIVVLDENKDRIKVVIYNNSETDLFVKEGKGVNIKEFSYKIKPEESRVIKHYNGIITAVWERPNGNAMITETI